MYVCVCMCMHVRTMYVCKYVCVCVCVCVYIYIYICVCVCVCIYICVCVCPNSVHFQFVNRIELHLPNLVRILCIVYILLGISPASNCSWPTSSL